MQAVVQPKVVLLLHLHMGGFKKDSAISLKYYTLSERERVVNCTMTIMIMRATLLIASK